MVEAPPTELQQRAVGAESTMLMVCEWATREQRRGLCFNRQRAVPAPLAQSGRAGSRYRRSEYVSAAARSVLRLPTA